MGGNRSTFEKISVEKNVKVTTVQYHQKMMIKIVLQDTDRRFKNFCLFLKEFSVKTGGGRPKLKFL